MTPRDPIYLDHNATTPLLPEVVVAQRTRDDALAQHAQRALPAVPRRRRPRGAPEIAASTGSACHQGHQRASAVILAMGVSADDALGSVRLTLGRTTTTEETTTASEALIRSWRRLVGA